MAQQSRCLPPLIWGQKQMQFPKLCVLCMFLLKYRTMDKVLTFKQNWPVVINGGKKNNPTDKDFHPHCNSPILTYLRSWALLEELPIVQPLKNSPAFYGTRRFNTVFTRAPLVPIVSPQYYVLRNNLTIKGLINPAFLSMCPLALHSN
jgi:hypothetical protein